MLSSLQGCNGFLQRANSVQLLHQRNCNMVDEYGKSTRKNKSKDAALTHAMAERKRRERINAHLHTLKKLFPHLPKKDKSRVLTEAVTQLKELRKKVAQQMETQKDSEGNYNGLSSFFLPGENDEVLLNYHEESDSDERTVKATVCCEDRPGLNRDLSTAVRLVQGRMIKAEMATVGGRTKAEMVVVLCKVGGGEKDIGQLKRALKAVVENRALGLGSSLNLGRRLGDNKWACFG
ncbi:putative transcription factor bHLH107 [Nicotiana tabacum]|uniref:Transcription factor bHLH107 n=3 Tax=Nicotiana TaxID=4085 RepID=A0A1S3ZB47_TOBAC|nr:PREDICTED: putative transcription factor bHLH107 isoform X1 [Nicotiana sylvestris]XP_016461574.1 PREDICTED: putative transcription factor bHLH107 [Nicotiana tabacum]